MQGHYGSEHALPLDQRFTLVLMTHNRPVFLRRALKYYSDYPCTIMVLDSSTRPGDDIASLFPNVDYRHLPQFSFSGLQAKLQYGVNQVTTPYMTFAADDDFLLFDALTQSVEFLEQHPDYGLCHGYCMMYLTHANHVGYYRRDKKVCEDYNAERGQDRVIDYMSQFLPPFYAVTATSLVAGWLNALPPQVGFEWMEISHVFYMMASAKARILNIPYVVREANYGKSDHGTEVLHKLAHTDPKTTAERQAFAEFLATLPTAITGLDHAQTTQLALDSFVAMTECLMTGRSLTTEPIFSSTWIDPLAEPKRRFGALQYMEMPFYNQVFFDQLRDFEFMLHAMPAGRVQLQELEGIWLRQQELMRSHADDTDEALAVRLWQALDCNGFNRRVVHALATHLEKMGAHEDAQKYFAWEQRLNALSTEDNLAVFEAMPSGRLLEWLDARRPTPQQSTAIAQHLEARRGGPQFCILVLDLLDEADKLQVTFDSLVEGQSRAFKVVVFTTGEPPAATTAQNTLHFIKVSKSNYIDKLNQAARQTSCDWLLLIEAGDELTGSGLLRAGLELQNAPDCRAVVVDEIQRQANGALGHVMRPGFNLDLLQSMPSIMARHWLVRRDVMIEAGGYSADFSDALELDLLLRIIEQGGMGWLAHLDEPLLICHAPALEENTHERLALTRHLGSRGYRSQVSASTPGSWRVDYRHSERPLVSILLHSEDNMAQLQRCLFSLVQKTRYPRYEVLVADNASQSADVHQWLGGLEHQGGRIKVLKQQHRVSPSALINAASREANGEYLVLLASDADVVNPNWIESLLNQAQRPEVGVVGAKLIDEAGKVTQAGLILGLNGLGSAFIGEDKDAPGYLHRLLVEQNYSAVSRSCLMVRKELFESVGGLDTEQFAEAFADVDLCLKIGLAGYLTVWTPQVHVVHPGTLPEAPATLAALQDKWADAFAHDLAYNKNLALTGKGFTLGDVSSVNWSQLLA